MRFESYIALRYLRGKRKNRFVSLITIISVAGVAVGVMTLIIVMSVMTGFDIALRDTIIGNRAHLMVRDPKGVSIDDVSSAMRAIEAVSPEIVASAPVVEVESILSRKIGRFRQATGAYIIGVDPVLENNVTQLQDNLGSTDGRTYGTGKLPGHKEIVLGYILANKLGARVGDEIQVVTIDLIERDTPSLLGHSRQGQALWLTVSGISQAKMTDFDQFYAFVNLETADLLTNNRGVDAIHCRLKDPMTATTVSGLIRDNTRFESETWYQGQQAFFEALKQEKLAMFIILVFIILVAAFNITSTLIMVVMEKKRDIGILRTIGATGPTVLRIFILEGLLIGLSGTFSGVLAGTLLAYNLNPVAEFIARLAGVDLFNSQIYYFDRIPVAVMPQDIAYITVCSVVLTLISTIYPAWSAARLQPVDALRYE